MTPQEETSTVTRITPDFGQPTDYLIGRSAIYRTYEGTEMVGLIESFDGAIAVIRMPDGRWGFSNYELELTGTG